MNPPPTDAAPWWADWRYAAALVILCAIPLVYPPLPPLTDLLGHLARYHVQLTIDSSPYLSRYFGFEWALLGNLGVDLLVIPLSKVFGLQLAVKLIALSVPPITAAGLLWIAREAHGRIPPTAAFALPLAFGYPFQFGFLNYTLAMAFAFLAFGLWLRLARAERWALRGALFVPLGAAIWLVHSFGWGVLGLLAFAAELVRDRGHGGTRLHAIWRAGLSTWPLWPPAALMLAWRSGNVAGQTADWFNWEMKGYWLWWALRERWELFDTASIALIGLLLLAGLFRVKLRFEKMLGLAFLILAIAFVMLPRILLGSAYADMRLVPYALAIGVIALAPKPGAGRGFVRGIAVAAALFCVARIGASTVSFYQFSRAYDDQLGAIDHIRPGSAVMVMVNLKCRTQWITSRMDHLGSQAILRRDAFANGQWTMAGAQLLTVKYAAAGRFARDPSQLLRPPECHGRGEPTWEDTLANFPRAAFDYFWLIDMPRERWPHEPDLIPIWHGRERGVLYRVVKPAAPAETGEK
ncbi:MULTISPECIES: hypothetical protein [Sphingomonadales]|uniref:Glycosyltransferase RgtA/B/C/D-like domain-containing protein n=1 Tax=Edaphosphingomonas haloaromaticamans TaxID=653954 RepID=A0A1S1HIY9_9SPHN|nr:MULTISPECIES: hypothetical protein [Sphingomonas]AGH49643.1 hypothetical protein G432_09590 [Sphingomonas sp. MM-1]MDX3884106.1 hypothetical protein [Sphingomonas sp.]OHT22234.1 hypothetical protein BHE75_04259 [Sphingomonas haloaromaticamans]